MILLIDNYDSFTYNLYQYITEITEEKIKVVRNDDASVNDLLAMNPHYIIISPGPGRPEHAGIIVDLIREAAGKMPILGVCLGMQAIGLAFDMNIVQAREVMHGKTDTIHHDGKGLFRSISSPTICTRYHSLAVDSASMHSDFEITSHTSDDEIMGIRHKEYIIEGVQFHPESIGSDDGKKLLRNFFTYRREAFIPRDTLNKLIVGNSLQMQEARRWFEEVTSGNISPTFLSAFLIAFRMKKITAQELAGAAAALLANAGTFPATGKMLDTCGTGGDELGTFNISSITALMAAACGARVAKHGNKGVSSRSGSSDFYNSLGIPINLHPEDSAILLEKTKFAFLYAPIYHPSMKHAAVVRKELGIKTLMNLLGPLVNPARASHRIIGVYDASVTDTMAKAARHLGIHRALFFSTEDGQDEISVITQTLGFLLLPTGEIEAVNIDPTSYRMPDYSIGNLRGGSPEENALEAWEIARGKGRHAVRDAMILNTATALFIYEMVESIKDGIALVREVHADGGLKRKIEEIIDTAQSLPSAKKL